MNPESPVLRVLRYLIDITRHLDRRLLDRALADALQPLATADEVAIFEFVTVGGQRWMRQCADSAVHPVLPAVEPGCRMHLVAKHPALERCLEQRAAVVLAPGPGQSIMY